MSKRRRKTHCLVCQMKSLHVKNNSGCGPWKEQIAGPGRDHLSVAYAISGSLPRMRCCYYGLCDMTRGIQ